MYFVYEYIFARKKMAMWVRRSRRNNLSSHTHAVIPKKKHIKFTNHIHYTRCKISANFVYLDSLLSFYSLASSEIFFVSSHSLAQRKPTTFVSNPIKYLHELFISVVNAKWVCFSFIQIEHGLLDYIGVFATQPTNVHTLNGSELSSAPIDSHGIHTENVEIQHEILCIFFCPCERKSISNKNVQHSV